MLDSDGNPLAATEVAVDVKMARTGEALDTYSDDEGHAEFDAATGYEDRDRQLAARLLGVTRSFETATDDGGSREPSIRVRGHTMKS